MKLLFNLLLTPIIILSITTNCKSSVAQINTVTETDTAYLRVELAKTLADKSETITAYLNQSKEHRRIFYDAQVSVQGRFFALNEDKSGIEVCSYGPIFSSEETPVYKYKRELSTEETDNFDEHIDSNSVYSHLDASKFEDGDLIVERTAGLEAVIKKTGGNKTTAKYDVISPIKHVFFTCDSGFFCCGLYCCSSAIKSFLRKTLSDSEELKNNLTVIEEFIFSIDLQLYRKATNVARCEFALSPKDYYKERDNSITSIYYQCPGAKVCCDDKMCCQKTMSATSFIGFGVLGGGLILIGIAALIYNCFCWKNRKSLAHNDYTMGRNENIDDY